MNLKDLKTNDMTGKEKREHIWEYYKLHIISVIVGGIIIFSFLNIWIFNPPAKDALDFAVRTPWLDTEAATELQAELNEVLIPVDTNETVMIEHLPVGPDVDPQMSMASEAKFIGKIEVDEMDILIMSEAAYLGMLNEDIMLDLKEAESTYGVDFPDELEILGTMPETGEGVYALNVNEIPKLHKLVGNSSDSFYVGIFVNSERIDLAVKAFEYIIN